MNSTDSWGGTPLTWAAQEGHEAVVKLLIDSGADVNAKRRRNRSYRCDHNLEETALTRAVKSGHEGVVQLLLDGGADVNLKLKQLSEKDTTACGLSFLCDKEWTAMTLAVELGNEAVVRLLLNGGADVNAKRNEKTAHYSRQRGSRADGMRYDDWLRDYTDPLGWTSYTTDPYDWTGGGKRDPKWSDDWSDDWSDGSSDSWDTCTYASWLEETALTIAVERGDKKVVKLLLDSGANVNAKRRQYHHESDFYFSYENKEETALMLAVVRGHEDVVKLLLADDRIDPNIKNDKGRTQDGYKNIVELLFADPRVDCKPQG